LEKVSTEPPAFSLLGGSPLDIHLEKFERRTDDAFNKSALHIMKGDDTRIDHGIEDKFNDIEEVDALVSMGFLVVLKKFREKDDNLGDIMDSDAAFLHEVLDAGFDATKHRGIVLHDKSNILLFMV
jgi:hypothetical protein